MDISELNLVIFYENVTSYIRCIQRKRRTGRKDKGRVIVLIAKNTIDETYYFIGKRKIESAKNMGAKMIKHLEKDEKILDDFF